MADGLIGIGDLVLFVGQDEPFLLNPILFVMGRKGERLLAPVGGQTLPKIDGIVQTKVAGSVFWGKDRNPFLEEGRR